MLCVCSSFFRSILARPSRPDRAGQHPIVYLKDVAPQHLEQLMQYMYHGEINVLQEDLAPLIEAARCLQIKGLSDAPTSHSSSAASNSSSSAAQQQLPKLRPPPSLSHPPPMKKAARSSGSGSGSNHHLQSQKRKQQQQHQQHLESQLQQKTSLQHHLQQQQPHFNLPTEPEPAEAIMKGEEVSQQMGGWPGMMGDDGEGPGDYEMNHEMFQDQDMQQGDEDMYGSQVNRLVDLFFSRCLEHSQLPRFTNLPKWKTKLHFS